jgi:hypothetical protein
MTTQLSALHEAALAAAQAAYCAHDVPGSDKRLCYSGRVVRAVRLQSEAHKAKDKERIKRIQVAIDKIEVEWREKAALARQAIARYHSVGGTAQISVTCQCEECMALDPPTVRHIKVVPSDVEIEFVAPERRATWQDKKREAAIEKSRAKKFSQDLLEFGRANR